LEPAARPASSARPPGLRRFLARLFAVFILVLAGYHGLVLWQVWQLRKHNPDTTAFMRRGLEHLQSSNPGTRLQHRWVTYEQISMHLKRAVIAAEDQRFLDHEGFDVEAIHEAYEKNELRGRVRHGASTISQQLAKNLFLTPQRTYLRKAQEAVITLMIERVLSKRRILEVYLNVIEWGTGVYGAEAAAQHYYGKAAAELEPEEAARLAAMIPNPRLYTQNPTTPYLEQRTEILLSEMEYVRVP